MSTEGKPAPSKRLGCWAPSVLVVSLTVLQVSDSSLSVGAVLRALAISVGCLVVFTAAVLTFAMVRAALQNRRRFRHPVDPQPALTTRDDPDAAPGFAVAVDRMAAALTPLGYSSPAFLNCQSAIGPIVVALMMNERTRTVARMSSTLGGQSIHRIVGPSIATGFVDDTHHLTFLQSETYCKFSTFPRHKGSTRLIVLDVDDPAVVLQLHEAAVERRITGRRTLSSSNPVEFQRESSRREWEARVRAGEIVLDGDAYRMTYLWTLKLALQLTPPIPQLRVRAARRRTAKALRELSA
ncbi:hypothetical protein [Paludisphaera rhizosphaerae]|uniref:hypothetical protein n=1 Tax=Paludisphaera rhizosphaerae TaxID=2711216 RepID=UPI0013ED46B6|nr:hypothetical protein [Paludisphaera rhizosphaerae]